MTAGVDTRARSLARWATVPSAAAAGMLPGCWLRARRRVVDEHGVQGDEHEAEDGHDTERPAPAELDREDPAEEHAEHGAEGPAGHERTGERGALGRGEDHEDDGEADAAVGRLTETDEEAGEHHLLVVGRDGAAEGGEAPQGAHGDDGLGAAPAVTEQRQRDGEQAHGQGDDAGQRAELGVGEGPLELEEGEDGGEHLARHVVGQEQTEGEDEDGDGEEPGPGAAAAGADGRSVGGAAVVVVDMCCSRVVMVGPRTSLAAAVRGARGSSPRPTSSWDACGRWTQAWKVKPSWPGWRLGA